MKQLSGKNILITGAASGIGKLMAGYFAEENAHLALIDINQDLLNQTKNQIGEKGVKVQAYTCDISDEQSVDATISNVMKDFKQIDILINNAGIVVGKNFLDLKAQDFRKVLDVNLMGMILMTQKILPQMMARKTGHIVNIASTAGFIGMPKMSEYCASKFADIGVSDSLRMELKKSGYKDIKITIVCPYVIATGMFNGFKPLFLNPVLKPEKVARKIVRAVKKNKPYLIIPFYLKYLYLLKILPVGFQDWLLLLLGSGRAMENFVGKK
jgi:all-trans-retinol dehydrogenase (NAD+)